MNIFLYCNISTELVAGFCEEFACVMYFENETKSGRGSFLEMVRTDNLNFAYEWSQNLQCFFPQNVAQAVGTPLFILNSAIDSWQVSYHIQIHMQLFFSLDDQVNSLD